MSHPQQLQFVSLVKSYLMRGPDISSIKLLEIGAYDVNGTMRSFFSGADHIGADLAEGPGVDMVCSGHELTFPNDTFDVAISCECFEHNPFWVETFENMLRMTKPGGLIIITCAARGRLEHGTRRTTPQTSPGTQAIGLDYYCNLDEEDFRKAISFDSRFQYHRFFNVPSSFDTYFVGVKSGRPIFSSNYAAVAKGVQAIIDERPPLTLRRTLAAVRNIPVSLSRKVLSESSFQTFAAHYLRTMEPLDNFFKNLLRGASRN